MREGGHRPEDLARDKSVVDALIVTISLIMADGGINESKMAMAFLWGFVFPPPPGTYLRRN